MLEDAVRNLATSPSIAIISSHLPGGAIQSQMVWVDADEEHLLVNTVVTHQKFRNVTKDPRVTVTLVDPHAPSRYIEVRGRVVESVVGREARSHLDRVAEKYTGGPYARAVTADRVLLKILPERQRAFGGGRAHSERPAGDV